MYVLTGILLTRLYCILTYTYEQVKFIDLCIFIRLDIVNIFVVVYRLGSKLLVLPKLYIQKNPSDHL